MALARIGGLRPEKRREELLSNYNGEEPYMPGGYDTPYNGEEPFLPNEYDSPYDDGYDDYGDDYGGGYDDGYRDGGRYDDDYGYDEAYGYDGDDYPPEDEDYDRAPYYDAPAYDPRRDGASGGELWRYVDEHDWVTWLLLLLCPPVGIWLLWRRGRYTPGVNAVLSALSALWLASVVFVVVKQPFRPTGDTTITPQPVGAAAVAAAQSQEQPAEPEQAEVVPVEQVDESNAVYSVTGTPYYHQDQSCVAIPAGGEVNRVSRNTAVDASLMACPYCMAGQYSDGMWDLVYVNADTEDQSNRKVYCSPFNTRFHVNDTCSDIGGDAHEVSLKDALLMAKTACEVCCPDMGGEYYCTRAGNYYHVEQDCSGMRDASKVSCAEARVIGKKRCPVCIGGEDETDADTEADASGYYVYATPNGAYYHVNPTCSGMKGAEKVLLKDMIRKGRPACPECCPDAETLVYAETGNPYYHSYATCSGMTQATQGILVNALAAGLTRCPVCWSSGGEGS